MPDPTPNSVLYDAITSVAPGLSKAKRRELCTVVENALPEASQRARLEAEVKRLRDVILETHWQRPRQIARRLGVKLDLKRWDKLARRSEDGNLDAWNEMRRMLFP